MAAAPGQNPNHWEKSTNLLRWPIPEFPDGPTRMEAGQRSGIAYIVGIHTNNPALGGELFCGYITAISLDRDINEEEEMRAPHTFPKDNETEVCTDTDIPDEQYPLTLPYETWSTVANASGKR